MGKNITLATTFATPTSGQLGYTSVVAYNSTYSSLANTTASMVNIPVPIGVWLVTAGCRFGGGTVPNNINVGISNVGVYLQAYSPTSIGIVANMFGNSTLVVTNTSATTWYFIAQNNNSVNIPIDSICVQMTRIA